MIRKNDLNRDFQSTAGASSMPAVASLPEGVGGGGGSGIRAGGRTDAAAAAAAVPRFHKDFNTLPFTCRFWDNANNSVLFGPVGLPVRDLIIDARPPAVVSTSVYRVSSSPARIGTNITIALVANEPSLLAGYGEW